MNKLLKYGKGSQKLGFADASNNFTDSKIASREQQIDYLNNTANNCRWWYEPIFANESKYLPTSFDNTNPTTIELTSPPQLSTQSDTLINALLYGGVAIVLYKLFTT